MKMLKVGYRFGPIILVNGFYVICIIGNGAYDFQVILPSRNIRITLYKSQKHLYRTNFNIYNIFFFKGKLFSKRNRTTRSIDS